MGSRTSSRRTPPRWWRVEPLEPRTLLAFLEAGGEFRVNTTTDRHQQAPAVAADADGDFVVAWHSYTQGVNSLDVYAQRYNAAGARRGGEFRVNTFLAGIQSFPSVAMDADGDFVVAWGTQNQDGADWEVYARRYNAAGQALGGEFRVNTTTAGAQLGAAVAIDAAGNFVVAWTGNGPGDSSGVFARRIMPGSTEPSDEFRVTSTTATNQSTPALAMDADGDFVVAWRSTGQDGSGEGVYARRFGADGGARGEEFRVNPTTAGNQTDPAVAMDADGDFAVAWTSAGQDGSGDGVYARRYTAAGGLAVDEFRVNESVANNQSLASAAMDAAGNLVVAWESSGGDGNGFGTFARRFSAGGEAEGGEARVNTFTADDQRTPAVAADADGDFVVAWNSDTQDGSSNGIYAQRYRIAPGPRVTRVFVAGSGWSEEFRSAVRPPGPARYFGYAVPAGARQGDVLTWGGIDQVAVQFDGPVLVDQGDLSLTGATGAGYAVAAFSYNASERTAVWTLARPPRTDRLLLRLSAGAGGVSDATGYALDGDWADGARDFPSGNGSSGGDFRFGVNVLAGDATRDGVVSALDLADVKQRLSRAWGQNGYFTHVDFDGSGRIDALDVAEVKRQLTRRLPAPPAASSRAAAPPAALMRVSATRELFAAAPIVA